MNCCSSDQIEGYFDEQFVEWKINQYRTKGLKKETGILTTALKAAGVEGMSLLDVGGGLGMIAHQLLPAGITQATHVEASSAFVAGAEKEARRLGLAEQMSIMHGDFVQIGSQVPEADVVTLDKVICCYADYEGLVNASVKKANKFYGLIYPRDTWYGKAVIWLENWSRKIKRCNWRVYAHPTREIDQIVRRHGFEQRFYKALIDWQIVVYRRPTPSS